MRGMFNYNEYDFSKLRNVKLKKNLEELGAKGPDYNHAIMGPALFSSEVLGDLDMTPCYVLESEHGVRSLARPIMDDYWIVQSEDPDRPGDVEWSILCWSEICDIPARKLRKDEII